MALREEVAEQENLDAAWEQLEADEKNQSGAVANHHTAQPKQKIESQFDVWAAREEDERARLYALEILPTEGQPTPPNEAAPANVKPGKVLGNYFLTEGVDAEAYKKSRIVFLHNNKAGGKSINTMLTKEARLDGKIGTHASLEMRVTLSDAILANSDILYGGYVMDLCNNETLANGKDCSLVTLVRNPIDRIISSFCFCFVDEPEDQLCNHKHLVEEGLSLTAEDIVHFARMTGNLLMEQLTFSRDKAITASCKGGNDYNCHWKMRLLRAVEHEADVEWLRSLGWPELVEEMEQRAWEENSDFDAHVLYEEALDNLRTHFAVIGITEDFDKSAALMKEAFSFVDFDPVHEHTSADCGIDKALLRSVLFETNATRHFSYDIALYEEAKRLFQEQLRASKTIIE